MLVVFIIYNKLQSSRKFIAVKIFYMISYETKEFSIYLTHYIDN
ncbi:hypothetical protein RT0772 [Rickettsia typhi str. Wilmington]|uniref:Uncharacterized protein n=1 Tax=Rickettsia typhi (strain ATCC VR-144 / Wilmington) TaxID=257363 RepID=Q68VW4_RICTY|nr:hypothetical protein RT0772 [Rickettsia typhi str. Wilmington]